MNAVTLLTLGKMKQDGDKITVPLGATLNMDGTAMMQGVATVFIANVYGVDLTMTQYLMVILTATLASIGTAAVPGVGLVMLTMGLFSGIFSLFYHEILCRDDLSRDDCPCIDFEPVE